MASDKPDWITRWAAADAAPESPGRAVYAVCGHRIAWSDLPSTRVLYARMAAAAIDANNVHLAEARKNREARDD